MTGCLEKGNVYLDVIRKNFWHVCGRGKLHTGFWWGNLRKRDHLEDLGIDRRKILKYVFNGTWTGLIWLRRGKRDGLL